MARPREYDPAEVDRSLLEVFWSRGFARASIEHLSEETGLLRGSLYAAYGDKERMFRQAVDVYVEELAAELATEKTGLAGVRHVLDTVVRMTVSDPARRGCLILNAIPESHALSAETQERLQNGLAAMQDLLRAHLRQARSEAGSRIRLDSLVALVLAASVSIRVLGRAGHNQQLLTNISKGAIEAVRSRLAH